MRPTTRHSARSSSPILTLLLIVAMSYPASSQELDRYVDDPAKIRLAPALAQDLKALVTSPLRARKKDWVKAGISLGIVGAAYAIDQRTRTTFDPSYEADLANTIRPVGNEGGLILMAGFWVAGRTTDNQKAISIGRDGLYASFLSAGIIVPILKSITGRERPRADLGASEFASSGQSFPSGEVTQAFAIAAVVSAHSRRKWVKTLAWTLATATAWQRIELDGHWASDVAAGALLGASIGHWVVKRNRLRGWSVEPGLTRGGGTISVRKKF